MSMDTEYCNKCGLLHDFSDGECLGCELQKEISQLKEENKKFRERVRLELKYILVQQKLTYGMNEQEACSFRERKILSLISELVMECEDE